jgi:hypothetical protein
MTKRGGDQIIEVDGILAKRGKPGTPQARTWVSLEPGYTVLDSPDMREIIIEYHEPRAQ